jgi:hypothetical protein
MRSTTLETDVRRVKRVISNTTTFLGEQHIPMRSTRYVSRDRRVGKSCMGKTSTCLARVKVSRPG